MNWATFFIAAIGGITGGIVIGTAQVFAANLIVEWRRRRADRREARMEREIAKEWCAVCGQRKNDGDHDACRDIEAVS